MDIISLRHTDLQYRFMARMPVIERQGVFLGALMTGMFVTYAYQRAVNLNQNDERFASVCQMVALITAGLLLVGVWNAPLAPFEIGLYPAAFFVCLMGQFLLQRSCNRALPGDT